MSMMLDLLRSDLKQLSLKQLRDLLRSDLRDLLRSDLRDKQLRDKQLRDKQLSDLRDLRSDLRDLLRDLLRSDLRDKQLRDKQLSDLRDKQLRDKQLSDLSRDTSQNQRPLSDLRDLHSTSQKQRDTSQNQRPRLIIYIYSIKCSPDPLPLDNYSDTHPVSFDYGSSGKRKQYCDPSVAYMQKQRILKKTGLLKEELDWPGISLIAGSLQKDGYITHNEFEQILDKSQPRRKAVDMLLKVVLGNLSTVSAFMRILNSESDLLYVAGRIDRTRLTAKEMNEMPSKKEMHVLQSLERNKMMGIKRKRLFFVDRTKRRKRLNRNQKGSASDAVKKIFSSLRTAAVKQKLRRHASKHLNLELKEAFMESFGIMFIFKVEKQSQKLKDPFPMGSESFAATPVE